LRGACGPQLKIIKAFWGPSILAHTVLWASLKALWTQPIKPLGPLGPLGFLNVFKGLSEDVLVGWGLGGGITGPLVPVVVFVTLGRRLAIKVHPALASTG